MANAKRIPSRPLKLDGRFGTDHMTWGALQFLKENSPAYVRPMDLVRRLGCTRVEAELSLKLCVEWKAAGKRESDGRYYFIDPRQESSTCA
jgi:hypothetical protein